MASLRELIMTFDDGGTRHRQYLDKAEQHLEAALLDSDHVPAVDKDYFKSLQVQLPASVSYRSFDFDSLVRDKDRSKLEVRRGIEVRIQVQRHVP